MSLITSPRCIAFSMPKPKSMVNLSPGSPEAALMPSLSLNSSTRKPSNPAFCSRKPILGFVHAEAAWSARSRGEEDVVVQNLLARNTFLLQKLEILHQISDSKICRITLAVVAVLFAGLKGGDVRHRQLLAAIAAALEDGANQVFVLPGETAEQNGDLVPLFGGKCALHRPVEVRGLIKAGDLAQSGTLSLQALLDFFKIGRAHV